MDAHARRPLAGLGERPFWVGAGAAWRQLGGGFESCGFSLEWHELEREQPLDWAASFHPNSVEVCLNLRGNGWVESAGRRLAFAPETSGFFLMNGGRLSGERAAGERHEFLSVEFSVRFLRNRLAGQARHLHPELRPVLKGERARAGLSAQSPLTHRQRDLLGSLLRPPVLRAAQRLWYESKALEFAAEFFFADDTEPLCSRAQRVAAERVAKAKAELLERLAEPLNLEDLGRRVGCSQFYLSRTFSRETGMTISQWLRKARLERAAELLRSGACNVTEAALEVGYSLSHFSLAFHETFGCCPGLYPLRTEAQRPRGESSEAGR